MGKARFQGADIALVAAGEAHSVAVSASGDVWTWGKGRSGQLGLLDLQDRLAPSQVDLAHAAASPCVLVAAGGHHTVAVTADGSLLAWGCGSHGQLGLGGDVACCLRPARVCTGGLGSSRVVIAACGSAHTLAATENGTLWAWGSGGNGRLGHGDATSASSPAQVSTEHFVGRRVVAVGAGDAHSAALTEDGALFTWGCGKDQISPEPSGLGHGDLRDRHVPTCILRECLRGARVGRCRRHRLACDAALAFAMCTHPRLGQQCRHLSQMLPELVQHIVAACELWSWPEGGAGKMEGLVRLLGGGPALLGEPFES